MSALSHSGILCKYSTSSSSPYLSLPLSLTHTHTHTHIHTVFFSYVKEEHNISPTLECLLDSEVIEGFARSLKRKGLQGSTIARYLDNLRYGLRYLYTKDNKPYAHQEHYVNIGRLSEQFRKQVVHSTAHQSWQALEAKDKWAEW